MEKGQQQQQRKRIGTFFWQQHHHIVTPDRRDSTLTMNEIAPPGRSTLYASWKMALSPKNPSSWCIYNPASRFRQMNQGEKRMETNGGTAAKNERLATRHEQQGVRTYVHSTAFVHRWVRSSYKVSRCLRVLVLLLLLLLCTPATTCLVCRYSATTPEDGYIPRESVIGTAAVPPTQNRHRTIKQAKTNQNKKTKKSKKKQARNLVSSSYDDDDHNHHH